MKAYEVEKALTLLLDNEAARIMDILLDMYKKKEKVNKKFDMIVENLIKKELVDKYCIQLIIIYMIY